MKGLNETMNDILRNDMGFRYRLLDRMRCDCLYYIGNGNRLKKYLWAREERLHIAVMRALYISFPEDGKPVWISMADIDYFEREMSE